MNIISGYEFWENLQNKALKNKMPVSSTFELTYNCNLKCPHCYIKEEKEKRELSFSAITNLIDQLYDEGCLYLTFTGGEIFIRKDCLEILSYASNKGFFIEIMTNGTLINKEVIDVLKKTRIVLVSVSLYSVSREVFEKVCGVNFLKECLFGIKLLTDAGLPLKLNMLVTKDNILELGKVENFAKSVNADFQSDPNIQPSWDKGLLPVKKRVENKDYIDSCRYVPFKTQKIHELKNNKSCINIKETPVPEPVTNKKSKEKFFPCDVGESSMVIDPYGAIYLCQNIPFPRFNIKTDNALKKTWLEIVKYREGLVPAKDFTCSSCDLYDYCDWCPGCGLLESGSLFNCVPYYKELALLNKESLNENF